MRITSDAFKEGGKIPDQYTMYGANRIPPLHFEGVPDQARSLALVMDDPDAPKGNFVHWILFNMDPKMKEIKEDRVPVMATQGRNDFGEVEYDGPKPPAGEHHYHFHAFALDTVLPLQRGVKRDALDREMKDHILEKATLTGVYAH